MSDNPRLSISNSNISGVVNVGDIRGDVTVGSGDTRHSVSTDEFDPLIARLGFAFDAVGYSSRLGPERDSLLDALPPLVRDVLSGIELNPDDALVQGTGDGANVFLPATCAPSEYVADLVKSWRAAMPGRGFRVRVAMAYGDVSRAPDSEAIRGRAVIDLTRILNSRALRAFAAQRTNDPVVIAVEALLYERTLGDGYGADLSLDAVERGSEDSHAFVLM